MKSIPRPHMAAGILGVITSFSIESNLSSIFSFIGFGLLLLMLVHYWEDVSAFLKRYSRYLYISVIYFLVLGIALAAFEQTETLFVGMLEDTEAWNLILFWVQFPSSVIIVWFLPYYLMFSDIYYKNYIGDADINKIKRWHLLVNLIFPVKVMARLINDQNDIIENFAIFNESSRRDHQTFHQVRRVFGAIYIIVLCNLLAGVSQGLGDANFISNYPVSIGGLIVIVFYFLVSLHEKMVENRLGHLPILNNLNQDDEVNGYKRLGINLVVLLIFSAFPLLAAWQVGVYANFQNFFSWGFIGVMLSIAAGIVYFFSKGAQVKDNQSQSSKAAADSASKNADDERFAKRKGLNFTHLLPSLIIASLLSGLVLATILISLPLELAEATRIFLIAAFNLLFSFMGLAYFRRRGRYETAMGSVLDWMVKRLDNPGTTVLMMWNAGLMIMFFIAFIATMVHFDTHYVSGAHFLNPLNIFFIFINGLMVSIAIVDRSVVLFARHSASKSDKVSLVYRILNWIYSLIPALKREAAVNETNQVATANNAGIQLDNRRDMRIYRPLKLKLFREKAVSKTAEETIIGPYTKVELSFGQKTRLPLRVKQLLLGSLAVCFVLNRCAGDYHELIYQAEPSAQQWGLEAYTEQFLASREAASQNATHPIYIIASDGGGLKAAYWTTRLLHSLETESGKQFDFQKDVFVSAGASGGSVGLGLYTYLYADSTINDHEIDKRIQTLGDYNFLSADFGGLLTRWPYKFVPLERMSQVDDRMDVMGRNYFGNVSAAGDPNQLDIHKDPLFTSSYDYLWQKNDYKLPLFITNTARVEDGSKGIMHPLDPAEAQDIFGGVTDLTYQNLSRSCDIKDETKAISFPDALMTTNRFPIFSPMAKIEGKGHFVDAGAVDNSGKGTVLQMLQYMKQKSLDGAPGNVYERFFENEIVMISIRCDKQRYFYATFKDFYPQMEKTDQLYYIPSFLAGAISTGLTGNPRSYEGMLDDPIHRKSFGLDAEVLNLGIPFYIESMDEIFEVLGSSVEPETEIYKQMDSLRIASNQQLAQMLGQSDAENRPPYLEPPLARMLSHSSRTYMDSIAAYLAKDFQSHLLSAKHPEEKLEKLTLSAQ
ncbi:MAG: hypothetical protein AAFN10_21525 [Bacteroidota bacterium]